MKLTSISAKNLKGQTFDLPLSPITFLVGANFAGKTARADAIRLLLLGHLPELGKTPRATFGLSSGREMEVVGTFEDESGKSVRIQRRWVAKGASIVTEHEVPEAFEALAGQFAVMLDASTYFALSDRARVDYVFTNLKLGEEWAIPAVAKRLTAIGCGSVLLQVNLEKSVPTPQEFVEQNIAHITEVGKKAKDYSARMEQTAQGLMGLRAQDSLGTPQNLLEEKRRELAGQIGLLNQRKGAMAESYGQLVAARRRRAEIMPKIANAKEGHAKRDELAGRVLVLEAELATIAVLSDEFRAEAINTRATANGTLVRLQEEMRVSREQITKAKLDLENINLLEKCPYCGSCGDGWKALRTDELKAQIDGLMDGAIDRQHKVEKCRELAVSYEQGLAKDKEAITRFNSIKTQLDTLQGNLRAAETIIAGVQNLQEELDRLMPDSPEREQEMQLLQTSLNVANDELGQVEQQLKACTARQQDLKRLAEAEEARDKAKAQQIEAAVAVKELRAIQAEMVEAAFRPLMETANRIFGSVLRTPLAYNADGGEIGTWRDGVWVGHGTFSGVEKLVTYAAIQAALCSRAPCRVMILDEMLRAHGDIFDSVVAAVVCAVQYGSIDQFVGIFPGNAAHIAPPNSDCKVISVG